MSKIYKYCDGYTLSSVTVNMAVSTCTLYQSYKTGDTEHRIYKVTLTFTLGNSIPVPLTVDVTYLYQTFNEDDDILYSNANAKISDIIPAGSTTKNTVVYCEEETYILSTDR